MGVLFQALEIIFEILRKINNEKIIIREISFPTYKTLFFFSLSLWTPPTFKPHNFIISCSFKMI
jgi:hypothetical protein